MCNIMIDAVRIRMHVTMTDRRQKRHCECVHCWRPLANEILKETKVVGATSSEGFLSFVVMLYVLNRHVNTRLQFCANHNANNTGKMLCTGIYTSACFRRLFITYYIYRCVNTC